MEESSLSSSSPSLDQKISKKVTKASTPTTDPGHHRDYHQQPSTSIVGQLYKQYERASTYLLDVYSYQFLPLNQSCPSSLSSSAGELSDTGHRFPSSSRGSTRSSSTSRTSWTNKGRGRRSEGSISYSTSSSSDVVISFRDRVHSIMAPSPKSATSTSVNPFDPKSSENNKNQPHSSKDCRRLSCESHRKCCGSESTNGANKQCPIHEASSRAGGVSSSGRNARSEVKGSSKEMKKRSSSCPRGPLFPIPMTIAHVKRAEYNKEKVLSPGSSSSSLATNNNITIRSRTPASVSHERPTFVSKPPTVFTANKNPSSNKTLVSAGNKTPTVSKDAARITSKTPTRTTTPKISSITGKPIPVTEVKAVRPLVTPIMGRKDVDTVDSSSSGKLVPRSNKSATDPSCKVTTKNGRQNSQVKINLNLNLNLNNDGMTELVPCNTSSEPESPSRRRLSIKNELKENGEYKVRTTNINVAVRLRPLSLQERKENAGKVVELYRERNCVVVNGTEFEFNQVLDSFDQFNPVDDQASVYRAIGKPLLDHALNGYNVCLFAYGQTGSGKTYSITGPEDDVAEFDKTGDAGIIPRFAHDLFLDMVPGSLITLTYIEIYNEVINNLLQDPNSSNIKYGIREHPVSGPFIPNLIPITVGSSEDLLSHIAMGNMRRAKAATASNEKSSRSHAIVTISVHQKSDESFCGNCDDNDSQSSEGERIMSMINIVDLAGSERVAAVLATGDRFKEGTYINKSLSTLGRVISELSAIKDYRGANKSHIPYRDSTLTFLLKESLGGNSKTCMLATISPSATQVEETLSTLRYASKASRIINRVRINEDPKNMRIRILEMEVQRLRCELESQRSRPVTPGSYNSEDTTISNKDKNNNEPSKKSGSSKRPQTPLSDTTTSPESAKSTGSRTPTSVPSSVVSTPKKTGKKTDGTTTVSSSNVSTPTKTSTPVAAKRKGKDQATVTERKKEVDAGTSTDEWEIPVVEVGDYKSNFLEDIETIFEGKEKDTPKSSKSKKESKVSTPETVSKVVSPKEKSDEKKSKSSKNTAIKTIVEAEIHDTAKSSGKTKKDDKKKSEKKKESTPSPKSDEKSDAGDWNPSPSPASAKDSWAESPATSTKNSKSKKSPSPTTDTWDDQPSSVKSDKKSKDGGDDSWGAASSDSKTSKKSNKQDKKSIEKDSWGDSSPASTTSKKSESKKSPSPANDSWNDQPSPAKSNGKSNNSGNDSWDDASTTGKDSKSKKSPTPERKKPPPEKDSWSAPPSPKEPSPEVPEKNKKKDKKGKDKKKSTSMTEDESVVSTGLNTAMIRDSTIDITETDVEADASRHVNFQSTQEIRYYEPSIVETTVQSELATSGVNDTTETISSSSPTPTKKDKKSKKDKKNKSHSNDLIGELKDKLAERNNKKDDWNDGGDWGDTGSKNNDVTDDLRNEEPILANVTEQDNNYDNWDNGDNGGDWGNDNGGNNDDNWGEDQGDQKDDWDNGDKDDNNYDDKNDDNGYDDQNDDQGGDDWNNDDWNDDNKGQETNVKSEPAPVADDEEW